MRDDRKGRWPCHRCGRWLLPSEGHYQESRPGVQVFACHQHDEPKEKPNA